MDEDTRSVEVYARVDTVDSQFRPGMYVTARIMKEQASAGKKDSLSLKK